MYYSSIYTIYIYTTPCIIALDKTNNKNEGLSKSFKTVMSCIPGIRRQI